MDMIPIELLQSITIKDGVAYLDDAEDKPIIDFSKYKFISSSPSGFSIEL